MLSIVRRPTLRIGRPWIALVVADHIAIDSRQSRGDRLVDQLLQRLQWRTSRCLWIVGVNAARQRRITRAHEDQRPRGLANELRLESILRTQPRKRKRGREQ